MIFWLHKNQEKEAEDWLEFCDIKYEKVIDTVHYRYAYVIDCPIDSLAFIMSFTDIRVSHSVSHI